jgi:PAS domain S-box-containing protein
MLADQARILMTEGTWKWPGTHARRLLTVLLAGLFLTFYAAYGIRANGIEKRRIQFEHAAGGYAELIGLAFQTRLQEIDAMHRFFEGSTHVTAEEFRKFVEPYVAEGAMASVIEWIPLVTAGERMPFEAKRLSGVVPGERISEYDAEGLRVAASDRETFFPVLYSEPLEKNRAKAGVDLASDAMTRQAMDKAHASAGPVLVSQAHFFLEETAPYTFRILWPVFRRTPDTPSSQPSGLMGFVSGTYRFSDIVEGTLSPVLPVGLDATISNAGDSGAARPLYVHSSRNRSEETRFSGDADEREASMYYRSTFDLADTTFEVVCTPAPGFVDNDVFLPAWIALAGGMMLTGLLTVHLHFLMARNRKVSGLVTERTEELRESRTRLELALSGADLGYWDWQVQTGKMTFSRRWARMVGYAPEELEPHVRAYRQILHPDDEERVMEALRRHLEGVVPRFEAECRLRHRDGHYIWILSRGRVIEWDDNGKALRICGTHLDITGRKLANQARDLLTTAVEQLGESLIITDAKGKIQYVNSAFERITGYSRAEVIGKFPHLLPGAKLDEELFPKIIETVESGKIWQGMVDSQKKDGTRFYENITVSPVFNEDGSLTHQVASRHDLTDMLRLEEEKQRIELQYQQAQKLESIGRLAGGVAHDLNNLLGPIIGHAEMIMERTRPDEDRYDGLNVIIKSGFRARDVVRQLLAFSRKQSLSVRNIDLSAVVEGVQDLLQRTLLENIRIEFNLQKGLTIKADTGQLEQILLNLAVNAQDAMPDGGLLLVETAAVRLDGAHLEEMSGEFEVKKGHYAMLQVSDTGQGMDQHVLDHIFEPFFSTKDKNKGTGLGLAMVYGTVKQHKGYIWAYSEPGRGTSFKIYFPLLEEAVEALPRESEAAPDTGEETVMVVEDDQSIRDLTVQILIRKGYQVLTADSATECIEIIEKHGGAVDLLLTDVIMPDMNGKELYARIAEKFPGLKVIYMSGYTNDIIAHQGVISEDVNFIQKPFSVRDVTAMIRRVLDGEGGHPTSNNR